MRGALVLLSLLLAAGCGGGSSSSPATVGLVYANPAASGFYWSKNLTLSTPTQLVLELQGPGGSVSGRGVVFTLTTDPGSVSFAAQPAAAAPVQNLAFNLGSGVQLLKYGQAGGTLTAGIMEKGQGNAVALQGPLCRVVLTPSAGVATGQTIPLTGSLQLYPDAGQQLTPQACAIGTLTTQ